MRGKPPTPAAEPLWQMRTDPVAPPGDVTGRLVALLRALLAERQTEAARSDPPTEPTVM